MRLIPSIDLRDGRCVRLHKGDFSAETQFAVTADQLITRYQEWGATWVHVVDLDGARHGGLTNRALIVSLTSASSVKLQVGGGVRSAEIIEGLLRDGVARVVLGSSAIEQPDDVKSWLGRFGPDRVCLAFDVLHNDTDVPLVRTRGWTEATATSLWDAVAMYGPSSLRHVLCTDVDRDGAMRGPNCALYQEATRRFPDLAWQASGGIRDVDDLVDLANTGVAACVSGRALLENRITPEELRPFLPDA